MCQDFKINSGDCCFSCCEPKNFVQDKICSNFTAPGADEVGATVIYATNSNQVIFASGFVKNEGTLPLTVQFVRGADPVTGTGGTIVRQIVVPVGGTTTFTVSKFDTIRVFAAGATAALPGAGEICITPRYEIQ